MPFYEYELTALCEDPGRKPSKSKKRPFDMSTLRIPENLAELEKLAQLKGRGTTGLFKQAVYEEMLHLIGIASHGRAVFTDEDVSDFCQDYLSGNDKFWSGMLRDGLQARFEQDRTKLLLETLNQVRDKAINQHNDAVIKKLFGQE